MKLEEFKAQVPHPLRVVTLVLFCSDGKVLLAIKARGFGEGLWNAPGGKLKLDENGKAIETPFQAACRETEEELKVRPSSLRLVAKLNFYFGTKPIEEDLNQQMHVFVSPGYYGGKPQNTDEMHSAKWFPVNELPDEMWPFDRLWIPRVVNAKDVLKADFLFGEGNLPLEHNLPDLA